VADVDRGDQVADVDRIERAAQDPQPFGDRPVGDETVGDETVGDGTILRSAAAGSTLD